MEEGGGRNWKVTHYSGEFVGKEAEQVEEEEEDELKQDDKEEKDKDVE